LRFKSVGFLRGIPWWGFGYTGIRRGIARWFGSNLPLLGIARRFKPSLFLRGIPTWGFSSVGLKFGTAARVFGADGFLRCVHAWGFNAVRPRRWQLPLGTVGFGPVRVNGARDGGCFFFPWHD